MMDGADGKATTITVQLGFEDPNCFSTTTTMFHRNVLVKKKEKKRGANDVL